MELPTVKANPWEVDTLDVYLHYCCPECDHKSKTKLLFVNHAFSCHPDAKGSSMSLPTNFGNQIYQGQPTTCSVQFENHTTYV